MRTLRRLLGPAIFLGAVALFVSASVVMGEPKACPGVSKKCGKAYDKKIGGKLYSCQKCTQALCKAGTNKLAGSKTTEKCISKGASKTGFMTDEPSKKGDPMLAPHLMGPNLLQKKNISTLTRMCTDPAARSIDFRIVRRTSQFTGRVEITGTIKNIGKAAYETRPNQQSVHLYEGSTLVKQQAFGNLSPGQTVTIRYQRNWNSSSPAEGEFPPTYKLLIVYDPDIFIDGNPKNEDCVSANNTKERSGSDINALF